MMDEREAFLMLRKVMDEYAVIDEQTWQQFKLICKLKSLPKNSIVYRMNEVPNSFSFVAEGLIRCFVLNESGQEYNKNFFDEGMFPGSMSSLLTASPSQLEFETIENSLLIDIQFDGFRQLLFSHPDLMIFHIHYLEKNWLLAKDAREIELVQDEAADRYQRFKDTHPNLVKRLPLYHIAGHLGITPTQLSRIRKNS